jgi:D-beta-D-heptose 7-phosphate kinase/D-beta-D-heptose 1-phosphate adenosyltransferase
MREALLAQLDSIESPTIFVVGDLMLDLYVWGDVERVSPEAPVQVLSVSSDESRPGGAGNVAANLAALGSHARCFGIVGDDPDGQLLCQMLKEQGVDISGIILDKARPTTVKTRMIAHGQQLLRVDRESRRLIDDILRSEMFECFKGSLEACDAVLVPDYGKGTLPDELLREILAACKKAKKPVLIDPARDRNYRTYAGCTVLKPNRAEAAQAAGIKITDEKTLEEAAGIILHQTRAQHLIITQGGDGMTIFEEGAEPSYVAGLSRPVFDVTGAGDTVLSLLGYVLAGGGTVAEAAEVANIAGGLVVGKIGASPVTKAEIGQELRGLHQIASHKLKSFEEIVQACEEHRRRKQKIVFTNGCFDLLHVGHIKLFQFAKSRGEVLIVGLNSDDSIGQLKGQGRPVLDQNERGYILSALEHVDYIVIFEETTPLNLIRAIRPEVLVKGADYSEDTVVGRGFVESYGGKVELAPLVEGVSSSGIMSRITNGEEADSL